MQILGQRNNPWNNVPLGTSATTTIGSHGCTITCIAMLADLTPDEVNRRLLNVGGYAYTNLVIWDKINEAIPWLKFEWRGYGYNNDTIKEAINNNDGCLVECDFDNNPATTKDKHWVLFTGDRKLNDPWSGLEEPTSKYNNYTGYAVINVIGEKEEDMSDLMQIEKSLFEELVTKSSKYDEFVRAGYSNPQEVTTEIDKLKRDLSDCRKEKDEQAQVCKDELAKRNIAIIELNETITLMEETKSSCDGLHEDIDELRTAVRQYQMLKSMLKNGFGLTESSFKSEEAVFGAIEALTRGGNVEKMDTKELLNIIWSRVLRSLDKNKE